VNTKTAIAGVITTALILAAADSIGSESSDPIVASFEREFRHQPAPARPASREAIDHDVLYELVNRSLLRNAATGGRRGNGKQGGND